MTNFLDEISFYSPSNPNSAIYDIAGHSTGWGSSILKDALSTIKLSGL